MRCPECGHDNWSSAERCAGCGAMLAGDPPPVHPGATFRDPDDLSFPSDEPDTLGVPRSRAGAPPSPPSAEPDAAALLAARRHPPLEGAPAEPSASMRELAASLRPDAPHAARVVPTRYAGFFLRGVAFIIDLIVLGFFSGVLTVVGLVAMRAALFVTDVPRPFASDDLIAPILEIGTALMFIAYFTISHAGSGQTIGKALLGIGVRRADLAAIGIVRSFVRAIAYFVSGLVFGLGFVIIALTPRKRGWHDVVAGTCVVRLTPEEV
jgi:uncharacterized RDD family membrane protein YckC